LQEGRRRRSSIDPQMNVFRPASIGWLARGHR
jgi:hypothetical protein